MRKHRFVVAALAFLAAACGDATGTSVPLARMVSPQAGLSGEVAPNEYIVVLRDDVADVSAEASKAGALGGVILSEWRHAIKGYAVRIPSSRLEALRRNPNISYIEPNGKVYASAQIPCINPTTTCPWGWDRVSDRALPMNNMKASYPNMGAGVTVWIIDTGVLPTHTQFGGRATQFYDEIANTPGGIDCNGHGTHVAGTAAGSTFGFASNAMIKGIKVLNCAGSGFWNDVIDGINRMIANKGPNDVANMSLGGGFDAAVNAATNNAVTQGIVMAVAAGNSNADACSFSPASALSAETIAATGGGFGTPPSSPDARASYSNFGTCVDGFAPGTNILSSWIGSNSATNIISGTSMASPHMAGIAAVWRANNPGKTPAQFHTAIWNYATAGVVTSPGAGTPNRLLHNSVPQVTFNP